MRRRTSWRLIVALGLVAGALVLSGSAPAGALVPPPTSRGYWFVAADGGIFGFGGAPFYGSTGATRLNKPIVGMAATPSGRGYWLVASDGGIFSFGDAQFFGSTGSVPLNKPIVGMAATPSGRGYWLVASDGGIFAFGDAVFRGSTGAIVLNRPVVAMATTPTGRGYWLVASDGGVFSFGDAVFRGSTGSIKLNRPVVGLAATPSGRGYWMVASDGGIFAFGDAVFRGSMGASPLNQPIVAMAATPRGVGYWLVAADGGVFGFGAATFAGSMGGQRLTSPIVGMVAPPVKSAPEVAVFYYPWHGTPEKDGEWRHWASPGHIPPTDIGANYFPARPLYSNNDPVVLDAHMAEIAAAGIDTIVVSWWGRNSYEDKTLPKLLPAAAARRVRVAIHLEPYGGRSVTTIEQDVAYLRGLGVRDVWIYDSDDVAPVVWADARVRMGVDMRIMGQSDSPTSVKTGAFAAYAQSAGFDGIYTYDAVRYTPTEFASVCGSARQANLLCSPSVSPGYVASRFRASDAQFVSRDAGNRYDATWTGAIEAAADVVSITSFNEWHEGTQIEPAKPYCFPDGVCSPGYDGTYGLGGPAASGAYLARTQHWSTRYRQS